jgi:hypothetical protein
MAFDCSSSRTEFNWEVSSGPDLEPPRGGEDKAIAGVGAGPAVVGVAAGAAAPPLAVETEGAVVLGVEEASAIPVCQL